MKCAQWIRAGCSNNRFVLVGALVMLMASVACSQKSRSAGIAQRPAHASDSWPAEAPVPAVPQPALISIASKSSSQVKSPSSQLMTYRSRDYGVSFAYPWQYSFTSAKALADGEASLQPKSDGHNGQFTLARIEIPKGFYPDSDFETGYFTLSLNEELSEQQCQAIIAPGKDGKVQTETVNGVDFRWMQTESGGHGTGSSVRNYAAFTNGTCYQVEMGVKTRNERGMAREVSAGQVLRRLDRILQTLNIKPAMQNAAEARVDESSDPAPQP